MKLFRKGVIYRSIKDKKVLFLAKLFLLKLQLTTELTLATVLCVFIRSEAPLLICLSCKRGIPSSAGSEMFLHQIPPKIIK